VRLTFRNGVEIDEPVRYALAFLENDYSYRSYDVLPIARDATVTLDEIRVANRIGARMSAHESEALLARRSQFASALVRIPPEANLCDPSDEIPWPALADLYAAADGVRGIGLAKLTKFLHKKRPELIPMLDSVVEGYLRSVSPIPLRSEGLGIVGEALTRSYKTDLDVNLETVRAVKAVLAERGYELSECRVMDIFTWAYTGEISPPWAASLAASPLAPDDVSELAADVGISAEGDNRTALEALLAALGYVRARRVLRGWRGGSQWPRRSGTRRDSV
jgi:hypothetical protein